ncbi:zinc finger protein [Macleaya cordata]|uniref:Zinc finger protein n=1 Tax=Macleaya cordata TaxID=56857 RepID=A0A200R114_MACCD|nr:zinc finger protein [Macleaya cordata]
MAQESWKKETEETECQTPEGRIFCANNCGFFGSSTTNNFCSKCYRDLIMKQQQQQVKASPLIPMAQKMPSTSSSLLSEPVLVTVDKVEEKHGLSSEQVPSCEEIVKQQPNRCMACRKRVGLTGFKCRCGGMFCSVHRYSEKHECSFDYRSAGREAIAKANPVVKAQKIQKI